MVNDSSVTHIIMVIDQKYTERANERSGGVGTESTILSNELYTKKDKNNIVAVLAETNVSIPTFYVGRIYIDLSQDDKFAEEFEKLVRWAFGKFKYEKPTLGTPPSFILADGTGTILDTNLEYRFATDALQKGKPNANGLVKAYLEKFNKELVKYNFVNGKDEAEQFNSYLQSFKSYLAEFKKVLNDVCHYGNPKIHQFYRTFFEELLRYQVIIPNRPGKAIAELEFYKFITWVLVLHYVAITLKNECFSELKEFLEEIYSIPEYFREVSNDKFKNFLIFKCYTDGFIENLKEQKYYSPLGELLKDITENEVINFEELCEADLVVYLRSLVLALDKGDTYSMWWPYAGFYAVNRYNSLKVFAKSEKASYFGSIKNILGIRQSQL